MLECKRPFKSGDADGLNTRVVRLSSFVVVYIHTYIPQTLKDLIFSNPDSNPFLWIFNLNVRILKVQGVVYFFHYIFIAFLDKLKT